MKQWLGMRNVVYLRGYGRFDTPVIDESRYQADLRWIVGKHAGAGAHRIVDALLVCVNDDRYERGAVQVNIDGQTVGWLTREQARVHRRHLQLIGKPYALARCKAKITGGFLLANGERAGYEVRLDLPLMGLET